MKQITNRIPNVIDLMKVGFLFMVIFLHALDEETRFAGVVVVQEWPGVLAWGRDLLTGQVLRCAVPGFFLLSGALLFRREFCWKANLRRKFRRLLVPYLLLNTFWLAVCLLGRKIGALSAYFSSEATNVYAWNGWQWINAYVGFQGGPVAYHLWFLRDLFVLNLLAGLALRVMQWWPRLTLAVLAALYAKGKLVELRTVELIMESGQIQKLEIELPSHDIDCVKIFQLNTAAFEPLWFASCWSNSEQ